MSTLKKVKILQIVDGFRMGGAENKLWELVNHLDKSKFECYLANVGPTGPLENQFKSIGVPIYDCSRKTPFDPSPIFKLKKVMQENQIDIVQNTLFWADVAGSIAAKWAGVPKVLSWETVTHEGNPYHGQLQRRAGYQVAMRLTDSVVAVSHEIKQSLQKRRKMSAEKIRVIHYGVDLQKFAANGVHKSKRAELGLSEDHVVIIVVARLEAVKGHKYFVKAFADIADKHPNAVVLFAGDGSQRAMLEEMVAKARLQERIRFLGIRDDVSELLNAADLFLLPSVAGEGLPNVILEAMACQKPIIACDVGGSAEAVKDGENGFVVPAKNSAMLSVALDKLVSNREMLRTFGENSRKIAEQEFSLEQQVKNFEQLYLESAA